MNPLKTGLTLLRLAVASIFVVHGVTRIALDGVTGFGGFLNGSGVPQGTAVAWILTIVEILGGLALATGHWVRLLALWFGVQIAAGIYLVHAPSGWFVVGAGRNGAEYSALILVCLLVVALTDSASLKVRLG